MSKNFSWEVNNTGLEKTALYNDSAGDKLSNDSRLWPQEILDVLIKKFAFLSKYPISLKVDKRDKDSMSAFLYAIIPLTEEAKISIPIIVKDSIMKPVLPFVYEDRFYPITRESIDNIISKDNTLGVPVSKPRSSSKTPWHFMQRFLQSSMFRKHSSVVSLIEDMDEHSLNELIKNAKIKALFNSISIVPKRFHVKTAYVKKDVYTEIIPGRRNRKVYIGDKTSVDSVFFKTAEINEVIASGKDMITHVVEGNGIPKSTVNIIGGKVSNLEAGLVYEVNVDGVKRDGLYLKHDCQRDVFYCKDIGFVALKREAVSNTSDNGLSDLRYSLSDAKISLPDPVEITSSMVGMNIMIKHKGSGEMTAPDDDIIIPKYEFTFTKLESIIQDEYETKYVFSNAHPRVWVYSKGFKPGMTSHGIERRKLINEKPVGYVVKKYDDKDMDKTSEDNTIKLKVDSLGKDDKYSLFMEDNTGKKVSYVFNPNEDEFVAESDISEMGKKIDEEGDRAEIEHIMLEHGVGQDDVDEIIRVADKEGTATVEVELDDGVPSDNVTVEEVKTASYVIRKVRAMLPLDKLAAIGSEDAVADMFSLHMVSPKNISKFMENIDMINDVIDLLCRYYIYKNLGLNTETDKLSIDNLEDVIINLYNLHEDFAKYKSAYQKR